MGLMIVNRKGFTLIEVILVVAIIALLSLILIPNVLVLIDKEKEEACTELENNIIGATKMYVENNKYELGFSCDTEKYITVSTLISSGDLKGELINPKTNKELANNTKVTVTYNCDKREFTYSIDLQCKEEE